MNVFNHLLPDDFVIGIGPLRLVEEGVEYHYYFHLVLATHTMIIHSEKWNQMYPEHTAEMKKWVRQYTVYRRAFLKRIGETDETYNAHVDQVGEAYEDVKSKLHAFFNDLPQSIHANQSTHNHISAVFLAIQHLRDLACK